ncbi:histidine kinase [Streptomyces griseoaurantiacus]|uniref:histidine kinase n=1 Tax=Streptomyces griseoaurantiacus TaxID=68213 RepID=UPI002ED5006B|nr:histidine kinase [Streptomyces jietaisiensis]
MKRTDGRTVPALLLCAQALWWPGAASARGDVPPASALFPAALVAATVTAALALRRGHPVPALVLVAAVCALGAGPLPAGATAVLGTAGPALALYTVAAVRDTFTAVLSVTALAVWQLLYGVTLHGLSDRDGLDLALTALLYATACGAGLRARHARRARLTAARRLRRAETERHRLPAAERRRMERELHDVSAHHLTAVVVSAGAASGLRASRPELAGEALRFAAETGREVTRALGAVRAPSPSGEELPSPRERLLDLVAGFRRLGGRVDAAIDDLPEGTLADAAHGIVREALTNAARHAPGAHTTVTCRYGETRTDVVVTCAAPPAGVTAHGAGLGGGRGRAFLRSRAREAGGTLTSGPTAEGGWEVRAALPGRTAAEADPAVPRGRRAAQVTAALALVVNPLLPILVIHRSTASAGAGVSAGVYFALLAAVQATALLWLRRTPRTARAALLAVAPLWPAATAAGDYTGPALLPPALSMLATCVALAAHAAAPGDRGRARTAVTRWLFPAAALVAHGAGALAALAERPGGAPGWGAGAGVVAGVALVAGAAHALGARLGRRARAAREAREERLAAWNGEAVREAWAERRRIAAGLETTVLARTADMVAEAEAGRLDATAERAREALAAMRALLDAVREGEGETGGALRPQPGLQALDLLAHQHRATGREVAIRVSGRVPAHLPTAVDLAAYHVAETMLAAGGDGPAVLELDAEDGLLTLTASGVPEAVRPGVRERLTARLAPLAGTLTTGPDGTVGLRLPLAAHEDHEDHKVHKVHEDHEDGDTEIRGGLSGRGNAGGGER